MKLFNVFLSAAKPVWQRNESSNADNYPIQKHYFRNKRKSRLRAAVIRVAGEFTMLCGRGKNDFNFA